MLLSLFERYLLGKLLISLFVTTIITIFVVWLVRAIQEVDIVLSKGQSILVYLEITLFGIAPFAIIVLPIALTISALHTIATLNESSELTVASASGLSRLSILKPFLFAAFLVSFLIYLLSVWLSPLSLSQMRSRITQVRVDIVSTVLQEGQFGELSDGVTLHVSGRGTSGKLRGLFIRDSRTDEETIYLSQEADFAQIEDSNYLILSSGQIHRRSGTNYTIVDFDSYTYDLSTLSSPSTSRPDSHRETSTYTLLTTPTSSLPTGSPQGYFKAELHNRLTAGLYPLAFIFWVVAILGYPRSFRQQQRGTRIFIFALVTLVRCLGIVVLERARYTESGFLLLWLVPLLSLFLAMIVMRYPNLPFFRRFQYA